MLQEPANTINFCSKFTGPEFQLVNILQVVLRLDTDIVELSQQFFYCSIQPIWATMQS